MTSTASSGRAAEGGASAASEADSGTAGGASHDASPYLGHTVPDLLYEALARFPNRAAVNQRLGPGRFRPYSTQELRVDVEDIALGLAAAGLARGDRVALLLRSDVDFLRVDLGCLLGGFADVPIYLDLSPDAVAALVEHSGAVAVAVADLELLSRFAPSLVSAAVRLVVLARLDASNGDQLGAARLLTPHARVISLAALCGLGRARRGESDEAAPRLRGAVQPNDLATIVYTSGTQSRPKGVMLTHQNLAFDASAALGSFDGYRPGENGEVALSFLPLAHAFQRTLCYGALSRGTAIYFGEPDRLGEDLPFVRPTLFAAVPRVLEKARERIATRTAALSGARGRLARYALARAERYRSSSPPTGVELLRHRLADFLVYRSWRLALGGRVRYVIAGGAAVAEELVDFFAAAGIQVLQGYGLTEASPVVSYNRPGRNRPGTVGEPLPGVAVLIADGGEVLVRGPNVMAGYLGDEEATRAAVDGEGWLHTGDRGSLDPDGFLRVAGRIGDDLKLSTGKWAAPDPIERRLERDPLVEHAVVLGSGRPYCVALLFLAADAVLGWASERALATPGSAAGVVDDDDESWRRLLASPELVARCAEAVERANAAVERWARVQRFALLRGPLTVGGGLLTPTLKVRRAEVARRYASEIARLYETVDEARTPAAAQR